VNINTKLITGPSNIHYPEPYFIDIYKNNKKLEILNPDLAYLLSSDKKIYQVFYTRENYNDHKKSRDYYLIVLYFNGRTIEVLDVKDNIKKSFFLDRIDKVTIDGKIVSLKEFILSNGFKFKSLSIYLEHFKISFIIKLIAQNIRIRIRD
jgi:hypothetical protein